MKKAMVATNLDLEDLTFQQSVVYLMMLGRKAASIDIEKKLLSTNLVAESSVVRQRIRDLEELLEDCGIEKISGVGRPRKLKTAKEEYIKDYLEQKLGQEEAETIWFVFSHLGDAHDLFPEFLKKWWPSAISRLLISNRNLYRISTVFSRGGAIWLKGLLLQFPMNGKAAGRNCWRYTARTRTTSLGN
jgi:hypothetical protein